LRILVVSIIVFAIDQLTKFLAKHSIGLGDSVRVLGETVRLTHVQNEGIAFGIMVSNKPLFTLFSVFAALLILYYLISVKDQKFVYRFPLALIFGGALGNIFDRVLFGSVVDFMDVDIPNFLIPSYKFLFLRIPSIELTRWPVFNVADVAVSIGMIFLFIAVFFTSEEVNQEKNDELDVPDEEKGVHESSG